MTLDAVIMQHIAGFICPYEGSSLFVWQIGQIIIPVLVIMAGIIVWKRLKQPVVNMALGFSMIVAGILIFLGWGFSGWGCSTLLEKLI